MRGSSSVVRYVMLVTSYHVIYYFILIPYFNSKERSLPPTCVIYFYLSLLGYEGPDFMREEGSSLVQLAVIKYCTSGGIMLPARGHFKM